MTVVTQSPAFYDVTDVGDTDAMLNSTSSLGIEHLTAASDRAVIHIRLNVGPDLNSAREECDNQDIRDFLFRTRETDALCQEISEWIDRQLCAYADNSDDIYNDREDARLRQRAEKITNAINLYVGTESDMADAHSVMERLELELRSCGVLLTDDEKPLADAVPNGPVAKAAAACSHKKRPKVTRTRK